MIRQANIIITHKCNLECIHCYMNAGNSIIENEEETYIKVCSVVDKLSDIGIKDVMITGGECTTYKYLIEILKYIKSKEMNLKLFTNGYYFDSSIMNYTDDYCISLDGRKKYHNYIRNVPFAYEKTIENIELLVKNGKNVSIQMTVTDDNIDDIFDVSAYLYKLKIKKLHFAFVLNQGRAKYNGVECNIKFDKILDIVDLLYDLTGYNIQFKTNVFSKYEVEQYLLNNLITFPFWIDIISDKCYILSDKTNLFTKPENVSMNTIINLYNEFNKTIIENKDVFSNKDYVLIEEEITGMFNNI